MPPAQPAPESATPAAPAPSRSRFTVLVMLFFSIVIAYMDRINISVVAPAVMEQYGWSAATMGVVFSAFFWTYAAVQVLGGWIADRWGGRRVLTFALGGWSVVTAMTPLGSTPLRMAGLRGLLGLGEGMHFPAVHSLVSRWFPQREQTRAISFAWTGIAVGNIVALLLSTWIAVRWGWPWVFYSFAVLGLVWLAAWIALVRHDPAAPAAVEGAGRPDCAAAEGHAESLPWRAVLRHGPVWALMIAMFANNWSYFLFLSWLPSYMVKVHGFSLREMGVYATFPYIAQMIVGNISAWTVDGLLARGWRRTPLRKVVQSISFGGAAMCLLAIPYLSDRYLIVGALTAVVGFISVNAGALVPNAMDIAPRHAGTIFGFQNTAGHCGAGLVPVTAGVLLTLTGSWTAIFFLTAALLLVATVCWVILATGDRVF